MAVDLTGLRFGRLTVTARYPQNNWRREARWQCLCDCGNGVIVVGINLRSGGTKSCGCLRIEESTARLPRHSTHRSCDTPTYSSWTNLIQRCTNPTYPNFKHYGGRGITVCDRWRYSFEAFLADMGPRPPATSIDRINVDGHYEPGNCRWATRSEQELNKRRPIKTRRPKPSIIGDA